MKSGGKKKRLRRDANASGASFDDDRSLWDTPFRPEDTRDLTRDIEEQDAVARRVRLSLPLEQRMNVLYSLDRAPQPTQDKK
jgi:hypothetical protein